MAFEFKDLGPILGAAAPLISKAVSIGVGFIPGIGPIAGPIVGPLVGEMIAKQFGVPNNPTAINNAINAAGGPDSEVVKAKLAAATEELKAKYAWMTEIERGNVQVAQVQLEQTGETMRVEARRENQHWFFTGWRPFIGWVFGIVALSFGMMLCVATGVEVWRSPNPLKTLAEAWQIFAAYFAVIGLAVGVLIKGRSDEKVASMQTGAPVTAQAPAVKSDPKAAPAVTATAREGWRGSAPREAPPANPPSGGPVVKVPSNPATRPPFAREDAQF
jgi:hypothetical protein